MLYGQEPEEEDYRDPSEGVKLAGFQTLGGQFIAPDPAKEQWHWDPNWRYIKRVNLDGAITGCFPMNIAFMLQFETPLNPSQYREWS